MRNRINVIVTTSIQAVNLVREGTGSFKILMNDKKLLCGERFDCLDSIITRSNKDMANMLLNNLVNIEAQAIRHVIF
ncbi:nucleoporin Nup100/Nsp100 [Desulfonatronospira thiodismutans ASO3-1]|uniref:Nucleoporin Nup100/Nsp100 n=1 Tax=Desulfonatronospira thiodismutans ASO3-1 TaxID=555779 RepID=D6SM42_9BACT|nr:nucleoporin Nup100/Nsp100 [Desulfonatronospira thiodismutans ASO3-1]